jgi:hypothetical protein
MERAAYRARKFGADRAAALDRDMTALGRQEGIRFAFDRMRRTPNTRDAHGLIAYATRYGRGSAAVEALFTAYFEDARDIGREEVLAKIGAALGLEAAAVRAALRDRRPSRVRDRQGARGGPARDRRRALLYRRREVVCVRRAARRGLARYPATGAWRAGRSSRGLNVLRIALTKLLCNVVPGTNVHLGAVFGLPGYCK